jgi:hypothetical protein
MVGRCGVDPLPRRDEIYSLTVRAADFIYPNMRTVRDLRSPI